jgi:hypothetical protein
LKKVLRLFLLLLMLQACVAPVQAQRKVNHMGFWTFGANADWSPEPGGTLDRALAAFGELKGKYGDRFNVVVEDLHQEGTPKADGSKTAKIQIKVFVAPPSDDIERQLRALGLVYIP